VSIRQEDQLTRGVDGQVGLDVCLVPAEEIGHVPDLHLRLDLGATEGFTAGVPGGSGCYRKEPSEQRCHVGEEKFKRREISFTVWKLEQLSTHVFLL
jgi:hypothetical protein